MCKRFTTASTSGITIRLRSRKTRTGGRASCLRAPFAITSGPTLWFARLPNIRNGNSGWLELEKSRARATGWHKSSTAATLYFSAT